MIFTKQEMKEKTIEEVLILIDNEEDLLIVKDQNNFYEALYNYSIEEHNNSKTLKIKNPADHVTKILQDIEDES